MGHSSIVICRHLTLSESDSIPAMRLLLIFWPS